MLEYGKMSSCAVAAMSALAEVYPQGTPLSSIQIAKSRGLSKAVVAKILTILSQHQLIHGTRGPGGGYKLAKEPASISLLDVVTLFESGHENSVCPFGPGWCGQGEPCPLHDSLVALKNGVYQSLRDMDFAKFVDRPKSCHLPPLTPSQTP